jgi:hypothetical protein
MCCFSRSVPFVGQTKIFARAMPDGRQALVYAMKVDVEEELAMVLPLPTPPRSAEDAVTFVDLSGYPSFFSDLDRAFPAPPMPAFAPQARGGEVDRSMPLPVVQVGAFEASFVPTIADFSRLDQRFRLPSGFFDALPIYADYGFAVFRLRPQGGGVRQDVHPMAFLFPRRQEKSLFFPTVHVHDQTVPATADFDHMLTCQPSPLLSALLASNDPGSWRTSSAPLQAFVDQEKARDLTCGTALAYQLPMGGTLPNRDVWLTEPEGLTVSDLAGEGDVYAWRLRATMAFAPDTRFEPQRIWQQTARTKLTKLAHALPQGMRWVIETLARHMAFAPLSVATAPHFLNGRQLWSGDSYMNGKPAASAGPGYLQFTPFSSLVEPQQVRIGFARLPEPEQVDTLLSTFRTMLDRAVA